MEQYPTFQEFMQGDDSCIKHVLIQCLATISGSSGFTNKTPDEIYDFHVTQAREIADEKNFNQPG